MTSSAVTSELEHIQAKVQDIEGAELVTCVPAMVRIHIKRTASKQLAVCYQFPPNYPDEPVLLELKSKVFPEKMLDGLTNICEKEAKKLIGKKMIIDITNFLRKFIDDNPLCVCSDEITSIKHNLAAESDEVKLKQKTSQVVVKLKENDYFLNVRVTIPDDYPNSIIGIEITDTNFPQNLKINFEAQAKEISRQCIQPPLRKPKPKDPPFQPKPQLKPVVEYFVKDIVRRYPNDECPLCRERALPADPNNVTNTGSDKRFVFRVYCSHLYHHGCLETYMKTPPFTGGKKCPVCNVRIFHEKFKIPPELAEARWAFEEARKRELADIVDFLQ